MTEEMIVSSPLGPLRLVANARALVEVDLPNRLSGDPPPTSTDHPVLVEAARQLREYFEGARTCFDVPYELEGTPFQQSAWRALIDIPYGVTRSYLDQARAIGRPSATRAIGAANGRNPIPIIVPCHRVIGSNGSLTGYGGGEAAKRWLLDHEARHAGLRLPF